jgi:hypothetical protein
VGHDERVEGGNAQGDLQRRHAQQRVHGQTRTRWERDLATPIDRGGGLMWFVNAAKKES